MADREKNDVEALAQFVILFNQSSHSIEQIQTQFMW